MGRLFVHPDTFSAHLYKTIPKNATMTENVSMEISGEVIPSISAHRFEDRGYHTRGGLDNGEKITHL